MNARTAQEPDYICLDALQGGADVPGDINEPPDSESTLYPAGRVVTSRLQTAGREDQNSLRSACEANSLILKGRPPGDEIGQYTFGMGPASGQSLCH